jgi:hypothetical protein
MAFDAGVIWIELSLATEWPDVIAAQQCKGIAMRRVSEVSIAKISNKFANVDDPNDSRNETENQVGE